MKSSSKKRLLADAVLIISILLIALGIWLWQTSVRQAGAYVIVTVDGAEVGRYSLSVNTEVELNGGTNHLVIEDGCAYLTDANCPDKLCVKQGKVRYGGQSIVCLPNRLTVRVISNGEDQVDFVA